MHRPPQIAHLAPAYTYFFCTHWAKRPRLPRFYDLCQPCWVEGAERREAGGR